MKNDSSCQNRIICPHMDSCSGCTLSDSVDRPPILLEAQRFFERHGLSTIAAVTGSAAGWRCRAKLAVRGSWEAPLVGLFRENSHDVIDIPFCQVHHPAINEAANVLRSFIKEQQVQPYQETQSSGELRYLQLVVQRDTGRIQLACVLNTPDLNVVIQKRWKHFAKLLWERSPHLWHSIWINANERKDNVIMGHAWLLLQGEEYLWERLGDVSFAFTPATFGQANLDLFGEMIDQMRQLVPINTSVTEFYCGVGTIGLNLADLSASLQCCEVNPHAEACFHQTLDRLPKSIRSRVAFSRGDAAHHLDWIEKSDVVIVDPPRKGLENAVLKALNSSSRLQQRLLYISCGWKAFQRDCEVLLYNGWHLKEAFAYLLFPGTNQLELLTCFDKAHPASKAIDASHPRALS